jgi:hypothetical protein
VRFTKRFWLYRKPCLPDTKDGEWIFDNKFDSYDKAWNYTWDASKSGSWKVWKIEEVLEFSE